MYTSAYEPFYRFDWEYGEVNVPPWTLARSTLKWLNIVQGALAPKCSEFLWNMAFWGIIDTKSSQTMQPCRYRNLGEQFEHDRSPAYIGSRQTTAIQTARGSAGGGGGGERERRIGVNKLTGRRSTWTGDRPNRGAQARRRWRRPPPSSPAPAGGRRRPSSLPSRIRLAAEGTGGRKSVAPAPARGEGHAMPEASGGRSPAHRLVTWGWRRRSCGLKGDRCLMVFGSGSRLRIELGRVGGRRTNQKDLFFNSSAGRNWPSVGYNKTWKFSLFFSSFVHLFN